MSYQVLARKWRPHNFTEVVGQFHVIQSLTHALQQQRLHHAYLFTGTRGVGKTTIARILAKAINCQNLKDFNPCGQCDVCLAVDQGRFLDLIEVDAASRTKVEDTRDLLDNAQYAPNQGRYKIYLIDEVHMLSGHSFNALLKTLEEPPSHVKFLLATTDPQKIPITVLSRCLQFNLKSLSASEIFVQMAFILENEKIVFESAALKLLARAANGSMRDGLSVLDQAIVFGNGSVSFNSVQSMLGTIAQQPIEDILQAIANQQTEKVLAIIENLAQLSTDFKSVLQQLLVLLHRIALVQCVPNFVTTEFDSDTVQQLADLISTEDVQLFYQIGLLGQKDLELAPEVRMGFEMVLLRMMLFKPHSLKNHTPVAKLPEKTIVTPLKNTSIKSSDVAQTTSTLPNSRLINQQDDWSTIIQKMNLSGLLKQLAFNCSLESINDESCYLILDEKNQGLLDVDFISRLEKALQNYKGTPLKLHIRSEKITSANTPALQVEAENEIKQQHAVNAIYADDTVQSFVQHFDATIIDNSIQPI